MNSLDFGVPQDRDRILMIGVLKGTELARKVIIMNDTFAFHGMLIYHIIL